MYKNHPQNDQNLFDKKGTRRKKKLPTPKKKKQIGVGKNFFLIFSVFQLNFLQVEL